MTLKKILENISNCPSSEFLIDTMEVDRDHVHILVSALPTISPSSIARKLKQESTIGIWKSFTKFLKKEFWHSRTFWSNGYFVATTGQVSEETVRRYIETQG